MAKNDFRVCDSAGHNVVPSRRFLTAAGSTNILPGEPVKLTAAGSGYVIPLATNEPVIGTTTAVAGIAASASTHTASADGYVDVFMPLPEVVYRGRAKLTTDVDSAAKILGKKNDRILLDLTNGIYTVATGTADAAVNGIVFQDAQVSGSVDFIIRSTATTRN